MPARFTSFYPRYYYTTPNALRLWAPQFFSPKTAMKATWPLPGENSGWLQTNKIITAPTSLSQRRLVIVYHVTPRRISSFSSFLARVRAWFLKGEQLFR